MWRKLLGIICLVLVFVFMSAAVPGGAKAAEKKFIFGLLMVGPYNDRG